MHSSLQRCKGFHRNSPHTWFDPTANWNEWNLQFDPMKIVSLFDFMWFQRRTQALLVDRNERYSCRLESCSSTVQRIDMLIPYQRAESHNIWNKLSISIHWCYWFQPKIETNPHFHLNLWYKSISIYSVDRVFLVILPETIILTSFVNYRQIRENFTNLLAQKNARDWNVNQTKYCQSNHESEHTFIEIDGTKFETVRQTGDESHYIKSIYEQWVYRISHFLWLSWWCLGRAHANPDHHSLGCCQWLHFGHTVLLAIQLSPLGID